MHAHYADSDAYAVYGNGDEETTASIHFSQFGAGSERFSDFRVSLEWSDVEALIRAFSEKGYLEAARLERARMLAIGRELDYAVCAIKFFSLGQTVRVRSVWTSCVTT
jgi:hypothetical protein